MKQAYQNRLKMWRTVAKYLDDKADVWKENLGFTRAVHALNTAIESAEAAAQGQALSPEGATQDKHARKRQVVDVLLPILKNTRAYALELEDHTLYQKVNYSRASLLDLTDSASLAVMRELLKTVSFLAAPLAEYGLEADAVPVAQQALEVYEKALEEPRALVVNRSVATNSLPGIMKDGTRALKRIGNLTHNFDKKSPGFSAGYQAERVVVDLGKRHNEDDDDGPQEV